MQSPGGDSRVDVFEWVGFLFSLYVSWLLLHNTGPHRHFSSGHMSWRPEVVSHSIIIVESASCAWCGSLCEGEEGAGLHQITVLQEHVLPHVKSCVEL